MTATSALEGATIEFLGTPTGVNDGADYVLPYEISIDGVNQLVACYDLEDNVSVGDDWQANILNLNEAAASGYFAGANALANYERVAWLSPRLSWVFRLANRPAVCDLGCVWLRPLFAGSHGLRKCRGLCGPGRVCRVRLQRIPFRRRDGSGTGQPGTEQAFIYQLAGTSNGTPPSDPVAPEPGTALLLMAGLVVAAVWQRRRNAGRQS